MREEPVANGLRDLTGTFGQLNVLNPLYRTWALATAEASDPARGVYIRGQVEENDAKVAGSLAETQRLSRAFMDNLEKGTGGKFISGECHGKRLH